MKQFKIGNKVVYGESIHDAVAHLKDWSIEEGKTYKAKSGATIKIKKIRSMISEYNGEPSITMDYDFVSAGGRKGSSSCSARDFFEMMTDPKLTGDSKANDSVAQLKDSTLEHWYQSSKDIEEENKYWKKFGVAFKVEKTNDKYDNYKVIFTGDKKKLLQIAKKLGYDDSDDEVVELMKDSRRICLEMMRDVRRRELLEDYAVDMSRSDLPKEKVKEYYDSKLKDEENVIYEVATAKVKGGRMNLEYFETKEELLAKYPGKDNGSVVKLQGFVGPFNNGMKNGKKVYLYEDNNTYYSMDSKVKL